MAAEHKSLVAQFREFIMRGNVVDLAVAVVVGTAFTAVVSALVKDLLTPLIAAIVGRPNFGNLRFTIHHSTFLYGDFINALITFLSVAAAVFFLVVKPLNYLAERRRRSMAAGSGPDPAALSEEAVLLTEIRDLLREQRPAA